MNAARRQNWPDWWDWELELTPHLLKRMQDRGFSETDLRRMLEDAIVLREDVEPGRWLVETLHHTAHWEVILEPDPVDELLLVITAYAIDPP
jgi:hypothetical protein